MAKAAKEQKIGSNAPLIGKIFSEGSFSCMWGGIYSKNMLNAAFQHGADWLLRELQTQLAL